MEDTLESRLNPFIDFKFSALNTCMLCTVENVRDLGEQRVDVKPLVNKGNKRAYDKLAATYL